MLIRFAALLAILLAATTAPALTLDDAGPAGSMAVETEDALSAYVAAGGVDAAELARQQHAHASTTVDDLYFASRSTESLARRHLCGERPRGAQVALDDQPVPEPSSALVLLAGLGGLGLFAGSRRSRRAR
jgi:hypothetical protein